MFSVLMKNTLSVFLVLKNWETLLNLEMPILMWLRSSGARKKAWGFDE